MIKIRKYKLSDASNLADAIIESTNDLKPWELHICKICNKSNALDWIKKSERRFQDRLSYNFAITDETEKFLGNCEISIINTANGVANLAYWVRSSVSGHGIATDAINKIINFAFSNINLNRLEIIIASENTRSRRVAEKVGANFDGIVKKYFVIQSKTYDAFIYSITKLNLFMRDSNNLRYICAS